ncbi:MAG: DUF3391 domain-containing protein, partial [Rubrivivax sp.]
MSPTIAVQDLRVGMYVHLDLGWMAHPFPLSSFRIASADQIAIIRNLGLKQLRWVPEKSELEPAPPEHGADSEPPITYTGSVEQEETLEQAAVRLRREQLAEQRAATLLCERQYGEAGRAWREATDA